MNEAGDKLVTTHGELLTAVSAKAAKALRHSFISYRIAILKSADQVALEAGNSPSIIFKHYRDWPPKEHANEWFAILPKEDQLSNTFLWDKRNDRKVLNGLVIK